MAISDIVAGIISDARGLVPTAYSDMQVAASAAIEAASGLTLISQPDAPEVKDVDTETGLASPGGFTLGLNMPGGSPALGALQNIMLPIFPEMPDQPVAIDTTKLFNHQAPKGIDVFAKQAPSIDTTFHAPAKPTLRTFDPPATHDVTISTAPTLKLPKFDAEPPDVPDAPTGLEGTFRTQYTNILPAMREAMEQQVQGFVDHWFPEHAASLATLEAKLTEWIGSGVAMTDAVDQHIYDRQRARLRAEAAAARAQLADESALGYERPQGFLRAQQRQVSQDRRARNALAAVEVAVRRHELEQQHIQFALSSAKDMRLAVVNLAVAYAGQYVTLNSQAVEYAKSIVGFIVETYNLSLKAVDAQVAVFRVKSDLYEIQIKAAFAEIDKFKALIEAEKLKVDLDVALIHRLEVQIAGEEAKVRLYAAEVQAEAESLRAKQIVVDLFRAEVEGYVAYAQGRDAEVRVYEALMRGDEEQVRAKAAEYDAYRAQLEVLTTQGKFEIDKLSAIEAYNRNVSQRYEAALKKYLGDIDIQKVPFDAYLRAYLASLEQYRADLSRQETEVRLRLSNAELKLKADTEAYHGKIEIQDRQAQLFLEQMKTLAAVSSGVAQGYGEVAKAIVSANNTMSTLVSQESTST